MKGSRDMNTPIEPNVQDTRPQVDEQRRRLSKGGLVAPIVLGTLLSRPVLGAAPYNCTMSGQMSGNVSSHGTPVDCTTLGLSPGYYKQAKHEWPAPYVSGGPAAGQRTVDSLSTETATPGTRFATLGTRFNEAAALGSTFLDVFHYVAITDTKNDQTGSEVVGPSDSRFSSGVPATLLQVLETGGGLNNATVAALGRAAVASLLNAAKFAPDYPLTGKQVIDMFNAVCNGGVYPINNSVSWNANQVKTYFESLYGN